MLIIIGNSFGNGTYWNPQLEKSFSEYKYCGICNIEKCTNFGSGFMILNLYITKYVRQKNQVSEVHFFYICIVSITGDKIQKKNSLWGIFMIPTALITLLILLIFHSTLFDVVICFFSIELIMKYAEFHLIILILFFVPDPLKNSTQLKISFFSPEALLLNQTVKQILAFSFLPKSVECFLERFSTL